MGITKQKKLIHSTGWDYLLLLDACRYDIFEDMYSNYLDGDLTKAWSEGSNTLEWLYRTWPDFYDVIYVSGLATVNSKGVWVEDALRTKVKEIGGEHDYIPADHFERIIDVWDWGFMDFINSVPPGPINEEIEGLDTDKQVLGHYIQPHFPWVRGEMWAREEGVDASSFAVHEDGMVKKVEKFSRRWVAHKLGDEGLEKAYRDNLAFVLDGIEETVERLPGRVVITADHGWYLTGDKTHPAGSDEPVRREVPWFVVR